MQRYSPPEQPSRALSLAPAIQQLDPPQATPDADLHSRARLIAVHDTAAKRMVANLCQQLGWQPVDTGDLSMS